MISVKALFIYPIKSLAGINLDSMSFDQLGPKNDRRYMLVDSHNTMLTQREYPILAKFKTQITQNDLFISFENEQIKIQLDESSHHSISSQVWEDDVKGFEVSTDISKWFSTQLNQPVRLIKFDENQPRIMSREFVDFDATVGFADGFQLLITQQSSLEALDLKENENMLRFRPNIVVHGAEAFSEDYWRELNINNTILKIVKPCARCLMPAVNPEDGSKQPGVIRALAQKRLFNKNTYFGQNAIITSKNTTIININEPILITKQSKKTNIT